MVYTENNNWKPKVGERYYIALLNSYSKIICQAVTSVYEDCDADNNALNRGWLFPFTEESKKKCNELCAKVNRSLNRFALNRKGVNEECLTIKRNACKACKVDELNNKTFRKTCARMIICKELYAKGYKCKDIGSLIGRSHCSVAYLINKYNLYSENDSHFKTMILNYKKLNNGSKNQK